MITILSKNLEVEVVRNLAEQVYLRGTQIPDFVFRNEYEIYRVFDCDDFTYSFISMLMNYSKKVGTPIDKIHIVLTDDDLTGLVQQDVCIGVSFDCSDDPTDVAEALWNPTRDDSIQGLRYYYGDFVCFPESRDWCIYWCCDLVGIIAVNDVEGWESRWMETFERPPDAMDEEEIAGLEATFEVRSDDSGEDDQRSNEPTSEHDDPVTVSDGETLQYKEIIVHPKEGLDSFMETPHWMTSEDYRRQFLANYGNC